MRSTPKLSMFLLAITVICMGLPFVFSNSVWPQDARKANPRIRELQQQRLAVLDQIRDVAKKLFAKGATSFETLHAAEREHLDARLAYAETQKDRIQACEDAVQEALQLQQIVGERKNLLSGITELRAQAFLLETQITRENIVTEK